MKSQKFQNSGASVPFLRPDNLALDNTLQIEVIKHAVNYLKKHTKVYDIIILLNSCPLRNESIDNSIRLLVIVIQIQLYLLVKR